MSDFVNLICFICSILHYNAVIINAQTKPLTDIFSYDDYLNKDYSQYINKEFTGKYYKVGIWGHRMKIKYGDNIILRAYRIEDLVSDIIVGTFSSIIIEKSVSYTVQEKVTTSKQVKVGITEMINASVKLEDLIDVGTSTQTTREYNFTIERTYAESLTQDYAINFDVDLDKIPSDKVSFSISRVAIFL